LQGKILEAYDVRIEPEGVPALAVGKILYGESCAICHGDDGRAVTAQARTLDPAPRDFQSSKLDDTLSPYSAFHMITFGIPGTGMASYETLSDEERWCLAFYVLALRHPASDSEAASASSPAGAVPDLSVRDLAHATDADLHHLLEALPETARAAQIARWRHSMPLRVAD
jgi:high-affinity iron transporter